MFLVASRLGHSIETRVDDEAATKRRIALAKLFDQVAMEMVDRVVSEAVRASRSLACAAAPPGGTASGFVASSPPL